MSETRVDVDKGKYTFVLEEGGNLSILRDGKEWIPEVSWGAKAILALVYEISDLRNIAKLSLKSMRSAFPIVETDGLTSHEQLINALVEYKEKYETN